MAEQDSAAILTKRAAKQGKDAAKNIAKAAEVVVDDVIVEPIVDPVVDETVSFVNRIYGRRKEIVLVSIGVAAGVTISGPVKTKVTDFREKRAAKKAEKAEQKESKLKAVKDDSESKGNGRSRRAG